MLQKVITNKGAFLWFVFGSVTGSNVMNSCAKGL